MHPPARPCAGLAQGREKSFPVLLTTEDRLSAIPTAKHTSLGHRCHRGPHRPRLVVSGRSPRSVQSVGGRLGHESDPRCPPTIDRSAHGPALRQRQPGRTLIVHSDRGSQFSSVAYRQVLAEHGLLASMSRSGNCYDNAFIESFWSSLKYELVYHHRFATQAEARTAIFDYIETFYNRTRLHSSLAYTSPITFESKLN